MVHGHTVRPAADFQQPLYISFRADSGQIWSARYQVRFHPGLQNRSCQLRFSKGFLCWIHRVNKVLKGEGPLPTWTFKRSSGCAPIALGPFLLCSCKPYFFLFGTVTTRVRERP
jgi:hypothetical protein